jgi:hypothetical protein
VAETTSRRTQALLTKKGIGSSSDEENEDPLSRTTPWLAGLYAHGVHGRIATGPNAGKRIPTGEAEEKRRSRNHPRGAAPMSMDSVVTRM